MRRILLFFSFYIFSLPGFAQQYKKCGFDVLKQQFITKNGGDAWQHVIERQDNKLLHAALKTNYRTDTIPVVFHIILTTQQLSQLGGETGIQTIIERQLQVINADYNARNADSTDIPAPFKPLYGNADIQFGLAHTKPDGSGTPGYEIATTNFRGFDVASNYGSYFAFANAKYTAAGGLDAWDPSAYLNVWIFAMLDNGAASNILGLTVPPSLTNGTNIPPSELGVCLNYKNYIGTYRGRTLTHELGHYFELRHIWGDDDGKCPGEAGGADDGIADTPPQSLETYFCPSFPKYDHCSPSGNGIMFMNYMDYTDDNCQHLFTKEQCARMQSNISPVAPSYSLTQHADLLHYPSETTAQNDFIIYPNPASTTINVKFPRLSKGLEFLTLTDEWGRQIATIEPSVEQSFYTFYISTSGLYFIKMKLNGKTFINKVVVQNEVK